MPDMEKVKKGLEQCISADKTCSGCPYEGTTCTTTLSEDVLAMLKEQETEKASNEYKPYNSNDDAIDWATIHKKYTPKEIEDMVTLTEEQQKQIDELKHRIHAKEFYEMNYAIMSDMEPRKKFCD